jgi:hypothetical protein
LWYKALRVDVRWKPLWGKAFGMIEDGTYDAIVVDAHDADDGAVRVELALSSGSHKGDVVAVRGSFGPRDALELLGLPATLVVSEGVPSVTLDADG